MNYFLTIISLGLAAFFFAESIRQLPYIQQWTLEGRKPFACHVCMSFWVSLALALVVVNVKHVGGNDAVSKLYHLVYNLGGIGGVCLAILYWTDNTGGPPPME